MNLKTKIADLNSKVLELNNNLRDKERTIIDLNKKLVRKDVFVLDSIILLQNLSVMGL